MRNERRQSTSTHRFVLTLLVLGAGCGSGGNQNPDGSGAAGTTGGTGGSFGGAGGSVGGGGGSGGGPNVPQTCVPPTAIDQPAAKLSQTGCMDPADTKKMAASVIPYEVNSPLWSDGADKVRGMALPNQAQIHVKNCATTPAECPQGAADDGKWVLPVGTVMVKSFLFDGKLVETRLFVHFNATTWVGYTYQWDEAQTDATIVADERVVDPFNTGTKTVMWHIPSRMDCMTCHTDAAGSSLGPSTAQMNRVVNGTNQIDRIKALNRFEVAPPTPYKTALANPADTTKTLEDRARSYIGANCGFCHRPDDANFGNLDLRRDTPLKDTNVCGASPERGNQGVPTSLLLTPGMPSQSLIVLRMMAPADDSAGKHGRMPNIASYVNDDAAIKVVSDWITSITSCPQ
jgi:uncharacterized repeat protein (TIGR03806 family)